jgi:6-phosphogluconolactonase
MKNPRRFCSLIVLLTAPLALLGVSGRVTLSPAKSYRAYVGTYTAKTNSRGIYEFAFDPATGKMSALQVAGESKDPSWVVVHPNGKFLYSANEAGKASTISAFAIEPKSEKLTLLNQVPALGEDPCYLSFDKTGKFLFVANYTSGNVVVFPILADGKLGEHTALQQDRGTLGPNKDRQEAPHAHWIQVSGNNNAVFVADLGLDRILVYEFDAKNGTLGVMPSPGPQRPVEPFVQNALELRPGTGPRHVAFSRVIDYRRFMYVLGELDSTINVFAATKEGNFDGHGQKLPMLPAGFSGRNDAAEIEIHPSGKFLYASNRGHDSTIVYAIDAKTGMLTQIEDVPTGGKEPRHFAIDPTGHFLLAEDQLSDTIVEFRIDLATGKLTPTGETISVPSPVCITFLPAE